VSISSDKAVGVDVVAVEPLQSFGTIDAAIAHRDLQARTNAVVKRRLQRASRIAGVVLVSIGTIVAVAWCAGLATARRLAPGVTNMKFNTAIGLILIGISVIALARSEQQRIAVTGRMAAIGYGLVGLATLAEFATGHGLWLDNPFGFAEAGPDPGRMATITAGCFVVMSISVLALGARHSHVGQCAGVAVAAAGTFGIVGHVFGISTLYKVGGPSPIALHTAIAFVIAGLAAIFARPDAGFVALISGNTVGGITVRRMLVPALVGPLVVGALVAGAARSAPDASELAAFTIAMMLLAGTLVCVIGASLRHVDLRRAGAEDAFGEVARALFDREVALSLLRQSEERTRRILETARDAFVSVDAHGLVEDWNRAAEDTFGWKAEDAIGRSLEQLIVQPDQRAAFLSALTQTASGGPSPLFDRTFERIAIQRDGTQIPVELTLWSIDVDGHRTLNAFARDISVRKAAEASIARLVAVVEQSSDAIITIDPSGVVLSWNRGAEVIYGYTADEMIGRNAASVLSPSGELPDRAEVQGRLARGESSFGRRLTLVRADGRAVTVSVTSSPVFDDDGRLVAVSNISHDISEQMAAESALRESEARTKTSLDNMLNGFAILRSVRENGEIVDFEWTYINPAGAATYGLSVEEMIGVRLRSVVPSIEETGGLDEYRHVVITGQVRSRVQSESKVTTITGVFDSLAWKLDDGLAITWTDVTDREHALAALRSSEERFRSTIENLHESLSVFTAIRDDTGTIVDFRWEYRNAAAIEITGFSDENREGRTLLELLPENATNGMLANFRAVVETGEPYIERSLWLHNAWGDGKRLRRAFDVRATKLDDGLVLLSREVTQQREQEDELTHQRLELERSNTEMRLLKSLADTLQSCATADEAYSVATRSCAELFSEFSGSIAITQPSGAVVDLKARWGENLGVASFPSAECWALRRGRAHLSMRTGPRCEHLSATPHIQCLCVPMMGPSESLGLMQVMSATADPGNLEDGPARRLTIIVAGQLSIAFANLQLRDSLREMSIRDPLTGLFNRRYMEETLNRELSLAARNQSEVGILVIDIDHFKAFNDTHGHNGGDAVLAAVGEVLMRHSRISDVACRLGGEEFILILPNCSLADAHLLADKLRQLVSALRVVHEGVELRGPTISCGLAAFPRHGRSMKTLIHLADAALYAAKAAGRDQVVVARPARGDRAQSS
jgi:diguanylate cyclase (GGDEF)-like protein/PAS domain S-box-containing protein